MEKQETKHSCTIYNAEAEYHVMAVASKELAWLINFLLELRLRDLQPQNSYATITRHSTLHPIWFFMNRPST
jgi:hypothetical protein